MNITSEFAYPVINIYRNYLITSSLLFFIPAFYGFYCNTFFFSITILFAGIASINFWWFGESNWRLILDKNIAYLTAFYYFINIVNEKNYYYLLLYIIITLFAIISYNISCNRWNNKCKSWFIYHMFFHFLLSLCAFIIIDIKSNNNLVIDYIFPRINSVNRI